jgi:hypothetical protein
LLLGENSPAIFHRATRELDNVLPNSRVALLPGQQHIAINTALELIAREVLAFLGLSGANSYCNTSIISLLAGSNAEP